MSHVTTAQANHKHIASLLAACYRCTWPEWFLWPWNQVDRNMWSSTVTTCRAIRCVDLPTRPSGVTPPLPISRTTPSCWCCACGSASRQTTKEGLRHHWTTSSNHRRRRCGSGWRPKRPGRLCCWLSFSCSYDALEYASRVIGANGWNHIWASVE